MHRWWTFYAATVAEHSHALEHLHRGKADDAGCAPTPQRPGWPLPVLRTRSGSAIASITTILSLATVTPMTAIGRVAVKVRDLDAASLAVAGAGAEPEAPPVVTPWGDRNRRFFTREGMQLMLFDTPL